jgi:hypothetical protein
VKRRQPPLKFHATAGFEHLDGKVPTFNGQIATPSLLKKPVGRGPCGICGGTNVRSYVSLIVAKGTHAETLQALDVGDADGCVYPLCVTCEALGQEVFLPAMQRRLRADPGIEA